MRSLFIFPMLFMAAAAFAQQEPDVSYKSVNSAVFSPGDRVVIGEVEVFESASGEDSLGFRFIPSAQEFVRKHREEMEFSIHVYVQKRLLDKVGQGRLMFIESEIDDFLNDGDYTSEYRISTGQDHIVKKQTEHILVELEVKKLRVKH